MIAKDLWLAIKDFDGIFKHLIPPTLSNCHFVILSFSKITFFHLQNYKETVSNNTTFCPFPTLSSLADY